MVSYTYDAWGNILTTTDDSDKDLAKLNPYRYRGYRYDEETSLYYLNSRYYNSEWGRFISADGLIGQTGDILGHNMFAYCQNNPVMMVDPSGYRGQWLKDIWNGIKDTAVNVWEDITSSNPSSVMSNVSNYNPYTFTNDSSGTGVEKGWSLFKSAYTKTIGKLTEYSGLDKISSKLFKGIANGPFYVADALVTLNSFNYYRTNSNTTTELILSMGLEFGIQFGSGLIGSSAGVVAMPYGAAGGFGVAGVPGSLAGGLAFFYVADCLGSSIAEDGLRELIGNFG